MGRESEINLFSNKENPFFNSKSNYNNEDTYRVVYAFIIINKDDHYS